MIERIDSYRLDLEQDETRQELELKGMRCFNTRHSFVGL